MRRPPPKKKTAGPSPARPCGDDEARDGSQKAGVALAEEQCLVEVGRAALESDLQRNAARIPLERLHPAALLLVLTDVSRREGAFTSGAELREFWESGKIQRVGHYFDQDPAGWQRITCPDGSSMFVKFNSTEFQLLDESDPQPTVQAETSTTMNTPTKKGPPKKKGAAPSKTTITKASQPGKTTTPAAPATPAVIAPVKPVAQSNKAAAAPKEIRKPKTTGNYKWLLRRLQKQGTNMLTTANNRASVRDGLTKVETYIETREFFIKAKTCDETAFDKFLDEFFSATIDR